jgi:hypothetical protein
MAAGAPRRSSARSRRPLEDYEQFLSSESRVWGGGTVVHGSRVLDDLVAGIERHRDTDWSEKYWHRLGRSPAALGCVPLSDGTVADAVGVWAAVCIVVDKQQPEREAVR